MTQARRGSLKEVHHNCKYCIPDQFFPVPAVFSNLHAHWKSPSSIQKIWVREPVLVKDHFYLLPLTFMGSRGDRLWEISMSFRDSHIVMSFSRQPWLIINFIWNLMREENFIFIYIYLLKDVSPLSFSHFVNNTNAGRPVGWGGSEGSDEPLHCLERSARWPNLK